jgi:hypothetical protein
MRLKVRFAYRYNANGELKVDRFSYGYECIGR